MNSRLEARCSQPFRLKWFEHVFLVFLVILLSASVAARGQARTNLTLRVQNGAWSWFGDPRSLLHNSVLDAGEFDVPVPHPTVPGIQEGTILRNAAQIRSLATDQAARHFHVRLRGTVIAEPGSSDRFVLVDQTAGIFIRGPISRIGSLRRGELVEVEGMVDPGEFAPFVSLTSVRKLGMGNIPSPRPVSFEQLISGTYDSQWVEVSGIVRRCETVTPGYRYLLDVATGGGRLTVQIIGTLKPDELVDSEVRLPGVSFYQVNKSRQVISPLLVVPGGSTFTVEKAAPVQPFDTPVLPSGNLLRFAPQGAYGHRVHLRGVVTHHVRGEALWIRDESGGLRIQSSQEIRLRPGDIVDVLGFPTRGEYTPMLEDAVFQKSLSGEPPAPVLLASAAMALNNDANLVALDGIFTGKQLTSDGWAFLIRNGELMFRALLRYPQNLPLPQDWLPGSKVRLTGIASVNFDASKRTTGVAEPRSFEIMMRSPGDFAVVQPPPWWTWERVVWLLGTVALALLVTVAAVVWAAKRRLRDQSVQRALAEAEFTAILSERNRMAREIHDTLAQGLSAISVQLEVAKSHLPPGDQPATASVELAHTLVRNSLAEARNSIWNMRSQVLETRNLAAALSGILQQLTNGTSIQGQFERRGEERRLPPVTENNLLRIGQEAITNAVTHANARRIEVTLEFLRKEIRLTVVDDGQGFNAQLPPRSESGFGLMGMRERAAELQGTLLVRSVPGQGTSLTLSVPLAG